MASTHSVLVGTTKGAFLLESDGARAEWKVRGPLCNGWPINHVIGDPETGRLWAFDLAGAGVAVKAPFPSPHGGRLLSTLPAYQRLDSMAVEADGNICVATLMSGVITVFSPGGEVLEQVRTGDPITTNICFAGPDMRTAYVTLSGSGRLAAMDWPRPGLKPFHNA